MSAPHTFEKNTAAWRMQVWASFLVAAGMTLTGILFLPIDIWMRGFMLMGLLFTTGSAFTLAKTLRDDHEAAKLLTRVDSARTEELLTRYAE
jgi:hypothetical protein